MAIPSLTSDDLADLQRYEAEVAAFYGEAFRNAGSRLAGSDRLLQRFHDGMVAVREGGRAQFHAADEAHNELAVGLALLDQRDAVSIVYEPPLPNTGQTIDFRVSGTVRTNVYLDVKTIRPSLRDRWSQYERLEAEGKIPEDVKLVLSRQWMGGELWHEMFASRGRMLEYSLELEAKIRMATLNQAGASTCLMLCGEGFGWHVDQLEDFVHFYRTGEHRSDDPFATMEAWYVDNQGVTLDRTIGSFGAMRRHQFDLRPSRLNWSVQPPTD